MSKGPVGISENELPKRFWIMIDRSEFCGYEGKCDVEWNTSDCLLCWHCKYRYRNFDIPERIKSLRKKIVKKEI